MSAVQDEVRQFVRNSWITALKIALTSTAPASSEMYISEEANGLGEIEPGPWSWYSQRLSQPGKSAIWTGAAIETWATLIRSLLTAPGSGGPESVDSSCMDILSTTNGLWAEEMKLRFGLWLEVGAVARADKPEGLQLVTISLSAPFLPHPVSIAVGFEESLFEYVSSQPAGDTPEIAPPCQITGPISALHLNLYATLGRLTLPLDNVLKLNIGSVLDMGRSTAGLVDVVANGTVIARGEIMAVGGRYAIKISRTTPKTVTGADSAR
jgi:flagellar motor switch/type III secretory pathway protein FliN